MKKLLLTMACAGAITVSAFAQLVDEKNVTITMDLQPVLQLNLQGPDQFDFTFDDINEYYAGITKYGANILRVSASVSFDLWAAGLSTGMTGDRLWDNVMAYSGGGGQFSMNTIPIPSFELHQFPANPAIANACDPSGGAGLGVAYTANNDYSTAFSAYNAAANTIAATNNCIYNPPNATPYLPPADGAAFQEKYISGGETDENNCSTVAGSYLAQAFNAGAPATAGYFFIMDYRLLPGLPVQFIAQFPANTLNGTVVGSTVFDSNALAPTIGGSTLGDIAENDYVAPGVYTMYIKYILVEDQ